MTLNAASAFLTRRTVFLSAASKDCAVNVNLEAFNGKDHMRIVDLSNGEFHGVPPVVGLHQRSRCARLATAQGRRGSPSPPLGADKFARASVRAALNEKRARATASVEFGGFCGFRDGARSRIVQAGLMRPRGRKHPAKEATRQTRAVVQGTDWRRLARSPVTALNAHIVEPIAAKDSAKCARSCAVSAVRKSRPPNTARKPRRSAARPPSRRSLTRPPASRRLSRRRPSVAAR